MQVGSGGLGFDLRIEEVPNHVSVRNVLNDSYAGVILCIQVEQLALIEAT